MKRNITAALTILLVLLALSACNKNPGLGDLNDLATTVKHTQIFTDSNSSDPGVTATQPAVTNAGIEINNDWMSNYKLTYTITEDSVLSELCEQRCEGIYSVTDIASGVVSFFRQNGSDIDHYILNPVSKSGTHTQMTDSDLTDSQSGFMKVAYVDPAFPTLANVEYQGTDAVAGRAAKKYTQSAYNSSGLLTAYAFVWIDEQYGFISKCQVYNLTGTVNTAWELKELILDTVSEESIGFSTEGYDITEENTAATEE